MKSLAMLNFNRLSPDADLCSKITLHKLDILLKNVLYCTHQDDKILKILEELVHDKGLQKQVDEFFEDGVTSPQTDQNEQEVS